MDSYMKVQNLLIFSSTNRYDYFSITHLGCHAFSATAEMKTMQAKDDEVDDDDLGQRDGFSHSDIQRLKAAYVCFNFFLHRLGNIVSIF